MAVLKHTGLDENSAFVLAYPTINFDNLIISLTSSSETIGRQTPGTALGCVVSIDEINSDLPIYKFNHKRLEKTLNRWVVAGAQCKFIDDSVPEIVPNANTKSTNPVELDNANLSISCTVKKTIVCASPLSSVFVQLVTASSNLIGQIPTQALLNPYTSGSCRLVLGKSYLSVLTGPKAQRHQRNREQGKGTKHLLRPWMAAKKTSAAGNKASASMHPFSSGNTENERNDVDQEFLHCKLYCSYAKQMQTGSTARRQHKIRLNNG